MKYCKICGEEIPEGRIKALPNAETCVEHSGSKKKKGFVVISGENIKLDIVEDDTFKVLTKTHKYSGNRIS